MAGARGDDQATTTSAKPNHCSRNAHYSRLGTKLSCAAMAPTKQGNNYTQGDTTIAHHVLYFRRLPVTHSTRTAFPWELPFSSDFASSALHKPAASR
eukprot:6750627-Pyramimonas_sp.AAC.1